MADDIKTVLAKREQDYDADPPRCGNCVYQKQGPQDKYIDKVVRSRKGNVRTVRLKKRPHPMQNPIVNRCTYGNFKVSLHAVCNEWRSKLGETIADG